MWNARTVLWASAAAQSGSHLSRPHSSPGRVPQGRKIAWNPISAVRSSSFTASPTSASETIAGVKMRSWRDMTSSCDQSFHARATSRASSRSVMFTDQKPIDGKASCDHTPSWSRSLSRTSRSNAPGGRMASMKSFS